jgi:hypothetical protein
MPKVKCDECQGSRRYTTGGYIYHDCEKCNATGKIWKDEPKEFKIDKEGHYYKKAIKKIKALHKDISDKEAEDIFDKELNNLKDEKNDSGNEKNTSL